MMQDLKKANEETREAWNQNASFWDEHMGEGNDFFKILEWPAIERLLALKPGETVLDVACGNGLTSRRMAALGAQVVAFDFAENMIAAARQKPLDPSGSIQYHLLDATNESALLALGAGRFDAALCNMALMDMAEIQPLMRALSQILRPSGRFVFSLMHPCFNGTKLKHIAEMEEDQKGYLVTVYSVKVSQYLTPSIEHSVAMAYQPSKQLYFFRPLHVLLGSCFEASLVMDSLEEPAFPPDYPPGRNLLHWNGKYSEIPPVLVARMRRPGK
jgi:2-polyprenyl-3-methyl-5-hydroxy-6-metoxy-1,4-benzoquinol methylase